jgi:PTS system fructose-specific IIC component
MFKQERMLKMLDQLISKNSVCYSLKATTKEEAIIELSQLLVDDKKVSDAQQFYDDVLKREDEVSTTLDNGIAIPHAKSAAVLKTAIAVGISRSGVTCSEKNSEPIKIIVLIASELNANDEHIRALSTITSKLLDDAFLKKLLSATSSDELYESLVGEETTATTKTKKTGNKPFIIGVTGCPTGVAHTYLAESSLYKEAETRNIDMVIETNGSIGIENSPTLEEIAKADAVIIASDKQTDIHRFIGKKVVFSNTKEAINRPQELFERALSDQTPVLSDNSQTTLGKEASDDLKNKSQLYKSLMNGVSFMIPFVVVGGLLIAVSLTVGGVATPNGLQIPEGSFWQKINDVGTIGFTLMIPILAGYIAYAIGDRPALAPGMIGGWIANNGSFYNAEAGTGFIGAIVAGLLVGYLVLYIKKIKVPIFIQPLMPIMVIPIVASLAIAFLFIFVIGAPISGLMNSLFVFLTDLSGGSVIILGLVVGLMQGFDMGGPFSKVVFLFSVGLIADGQTQFMGAQACAIPVAPLGMALATIIGRKYFDKEAVANGKSALAMGLVGISEGAIPFAASDPLSVIPANMIGSAVACIMAFMFGITDNVAHGGPIVVLLGAVNKPLLALACMITGSVVTAIVAISLKALFLKRFESKNIEKIDVEAS